MNMTRNLFDSKNKFKRKVKRSFEDDVSTCLADMATDSLDELSETHTVLIIVMTAVAVLGFLVGLFLYFSLGPGNMNDPFYWVLLFMLVVMLTFFEYGLTAELVAANRCIALTEKHLKHKAVD